MWVADLQENEIGPNLKWIKLVNEFDASYDMLVLIARWTWPIPYSNYFLSTRSIGNDGTLFYLVTNKDAPREKIITIDIADPNFKRKDLVPEQKDAKLEIGMLIKDYLIIVYKRDVRRFLPRSETKIAIDRCHDR